jgi:Caspase domain
MRVAAILFAGAMILSLVGSSAEASEPRIALVIGNSQYQNAPLLANPVNDAKDMAATLNKLGFDVIMGTDLSKIQMEQIIRDFAEKLTNAECMRTGTFEGRYCHHTGLQRR